MRGIRHAALGTIGAWLALVPLASATGRFVVPVSLSDAGSSGNAVSAGWAGASRDGAKVFFVTTRPMVAADTDADSDIYLRAGSRLELVTAPEDGVTGDSASAGLPAPALEPITPDGRFVVFQTEETMAAEDSDGGQPDLYLRDTVAATTRLVTVPQGGFYHSDGFFPNVRVAADGSRVLFSTRNHIAGGDFDFNTDVYEWRDGTTTLLSPGSSGSDIDLVGASADAVRAILSTDGDLTGDDDPGTDLYAREAGTTTLLTPGTTQDVTYGGQAADASADATHIAFTTSERLAPADSDDAPDVYEAVAGAIALVSGGTAAPTEDRAGLQAVSADGRRVFFTTLERLDPAQDTDDLEDIYARVDGTTTELVSTGSNPTGHEGAFGHHFARPTADGEHVFFNSYDSFGDDGDGGFLDVFMSTDGEPVRLSVGEVGDDGPAQASFAGASDDLTRFVFQVDQPFVAGDTDELDDLYERAGGQTTLVTPDGPEPCSLPTFDCPPIYRGMSADGLRVWFTSKQRLSAVDTGDEQDVYESRLVTTPALASGASGPLSLTEGGPPVAVMPALTVDEVYGELFGGEVRVTSGLAAGDNLATGSHPGLAAAISPSGDRITFTGRASVATYQAALRAVTFASIEEAAGATRTVRVTVDNGGASGSVTRDVELVNVNDLPVLSPGEPPARYVENASPVDVAPALALSDVDDTTLSGATARITNRAAGQDRLGYAVPEGIVAAPSADGTAVRFDGVAPLAAYRQVLRSVTYHNGSDAPDDSTRHVELTVDDGSGGSATATVDVPVEAVNDAPVVSAADAALPVPTGVAIPLDSGLTLADVDSPTFAATSVKVVSGFDPARDRLAVGDAGGLAVSVSGATLRLSGAAPRAAYEAALRNVTFASTAESGARAAAITVDDGHDTSLPAIRAMQLGAFIAPGPVLPAQRARLKVSRPVRLEGRTARARCVIDRSAITACRVAVYMRIGGRQVRVGSTRHEADGPGLTSVEVPIGLDERGLRTVRRRHGRAAVIMRARIRTYPGPKLFRRSARTTLVWSP